jgi:hypothetical protein
MLHALLALQLVAAAPDADPFAFFQPSITLTADDRRQLDRGQPIARILRAQDHELAILAAVRVNADGDRLVAWMRRIEALKKSAYVLAIGRFSTPPAIEDLARLALDEEELSQLRTCRPGNCGLKLSAAEMIQLQRVPDLAGRDWRPALQQAFRALVLKRVTAYLADGPAALAPYADAGTPALPAARFASVLGHSLFLTEHLPRFTHYLDRYPQTSMAGLESFVYWSKERLAGAASISAVHVSILRGGAPGTPDALVAGKQIFATHYVNASLSITAIVHGGAGGHSYLVYLNRSEVDVLGGMFGGVVRWLTERRLKAEAATVLEGLRARLESGEPPPPVAKGPHESRF